MFTPRSNIVRGVFWRPSNGPPYDAERHAVSHRFSIVEIPAGGNDIYPSKKMNKRSYLLIKIRRNFIQKSGKSFSLKSLVRSSMIRAY